jgi:GTP diphosphokinase / guanosine-3',5'-bis(diphosphate) 3'-diphosphatase
MGLHDTLLAKRPGADLDLIRRAYEVAARCHEGQLRESGDPYISHPVMVATIMAGLGADDQTLCAAILHDTGLVTVAPDDCRPRYRAIHHSSRSR